MFLLARALTYASLFIGFFLVYVPVQVVSRAGVVPSAQLAPLRLAGMLLAGAGGALALWCILSFIRIGRGTPAPFDPPRELVIRGPYRFVQDGPRT